MMEECLNCNKLRQRIFELENQITYQGGFGWKGKDKVSIEKVSGGWNIITHKQSKGSGAIKTTNHFVTEEEVQYMRRLYYREYSLGKTSFKGGYFFQAIINDLGLGITKKEFFGSRSQYYFPVFYYPTKILEFEKYIIYGGHGTIEFTPKLIEIFRGSK